MAFTVLKRYPKTNIHANSNAFRTASLSFSEFLFPSENKIYFYFVSPIRCKWWWCTRVCVVVDALEFIYFFKIFFLLILLRQRKKEKKAFKLKLANKKKIHKAANRLIFFCSHSFFLHKCLEKTPEMNNRDSNVMQLKLSWIHAKIHYRLSAMT